MDIGNIGISANTNIGVSAFCDLQNCYFVDYSHVAVTGLQKLDVSTTMDPSLLSLFLQTPVMTT